MEYILVFWTVVGYAGTQFSVHQVHDWRPIGEFKTVETCVAAAHKLNIPTNKFRCVKK